MPTPRLCRLFIKGSGGSLYTLPKILGHNDIKMTQRYADLSPIFIDRERERLENIWTPAVKPESENHICLNRGKKPLSEPVLGTPKRKHKKKCNQPLHLQVVSIRNPARNSTPTERSALLVSRKATT
jgi:hypothetical protein